MERLDIAPLPTGAESLEQPSPRQMMRRFCDLDADVRALRNAQTRVITELEANRGVLDAIRSLLVEIRDATRESAERVRESRESVEVSVARVGDAAEATARAADRLTGLADQLGLLGGAVVRATEEVQRDRESRERGGG